MTRIHFLRFFKVRFDVVAFDEIVVQHALRYIRNNFAINF